MMPRMILALLLVCLYLESASASSPAETGEIDPVPIQGGWGYERWLAQSRRSAEKLIECAPDRYGPRHTPLWLSIVDPRTCGMVEEKPPNWQTYWDAEDYVMIARGCNLYRDMPMLRALVDLSRVSGDTKYAETVNRLLQFYLDELPSATTGLFPWGEHMSYNTVQEKIVATRHEMEHNLPDWELLWAVHPDAVKREIEAIHRIHIYDKDSFLYDRHGNYYTGEFDPAPVRGSYIKHSGLYAYSFLFLYSKTKDPQHLEWARRMSDVYWSPRDPKTGIVPGYVSGNTTSTSQMLLSYYLMRGTRHYPDETIRNRALGMLDSFLEYGYNPSTGQIASGLAPDTGKVVGDMISPWESTNEGGLYYRLYACLEAYRLTGEPRYLMVIENCLKNAAQESKPSKVAAETAGAMLDLFVQTYRETQDRFYLREARRLAEWSVENLVRNDLILEYSSGHVYNNFYRPGLLVSAWLALYETEKEQPLHWTAPDSVSPRDASIEVCVKTVTGRDVDLLKWKFADGEQGAASGKGPGRKKVFPIPVAGGDTVAQGPLTIHFLDPNGAEIDSGTLLVAENANGPSIGPWDLPKWMAQQRPLHGRVRIADPSGIKKAACQYWTTGTTTKQVAECLRQNPESDWFTFTVPARAGKEAGSVYLQVEATGNPAWPIRQDSDVQEVQVSRTFTVNLASASRNVVVPPGPREGSEFIVQTDRVPTAGTIEIECIPVNPVESSAGLPPCLAGPFARISSNGAAPDTQVVWASNLERGDGVLPSTLGIFRWDHHRWTAVEGSAFDQRHSGVSFGVGEGGFFALGGEARLLRRRTFNGALLSSPAAARIDKKGRLAIILDTRPYDGILYALDPDGNTIWTYETGDRQPFPTVADIDDDGLDEIAVGGTSLSLLGPDGTVLWQSPMQDVSSPAIGDLDADGSMEIAIATGGGRVAAFSVAGKEKWRADVGEELEIPSLGDLGGGKGLELVVGGNSNLYVFSGDGSLFWKKPLPGKMMYSPAVADTDGDGLEEVFCYSRTDTEGTLSAFDHDGSLLWETAVSREPDWCPVVAAVDVPGEPRIIAQSVDVRKLDIFDAGGRKVRSLKTTGRTLQTPVPVDLDLDGRLDVLTANDLSYRVWAIGNDGEPLWSYTPQSFTLPGAKIKGGGSLLVADLDGDRRLEVIGGDDETWLNILRTDTPCEPFAVVSGQFHGDCRHSGNYTAPCRRDSQ